MDIKYKLKLVEVLRLRPADIELISSINLPDECLDAMMKENYTPLAQELSAIATNKDEPEDVRLIAASLKTMLLWDSASDELDAACNNMLLEDDAELDNTPIEEA